MVVWSSSKMMFFQIKDIPRYSRYTKLKKEQKENKRRMWMIRIANIWKMTLGDSQSKKISL